MYGARNDNSSSSSSGGEANVTKSDLRRSDCDDSFPESEPSRLDFELNVVVSELRETVSDPYVTSSGGESSDDVPSDIDSGDKAPGLHRDGTIL